MSKFKNIFTIFLILLMSASIFIGCTTSESEDSSDDSSADQEEPSGDGDDDDISGDGDGDIISDDDTPVEYIKTVVLNEVMSSNSESYPDENGNFPDWIEIYNYGDQALSLKNFRLLDDTSTWLFPAVDLEPETMLVVFASGKDTMNLSTIPPSLHTNFRIRSSGEKIRLVAPDGEVLDTLETNELPENVSMGRQPDGSGLWQYFNESTPGETNNTTAYTSIDDLPGPDLADIVINEVMASNGESYQDEDGDYVDWIELYNYGAEPINLQGYGLSDGGNPWIFPHTNLEPSEYLVVFASGKDRVVNHVETIIDQGDVWRYKLGAPDIPNEWTGISYDDSGWDEGPSGFGFGDGDDATEVDQTISIFIRKKFTVNDLDNIAIILFHVDYDDGFVAYINGEEIARANVDGIPPAWDQAASDREAIMYQGSAPVYYTRRDIQALLNPGENVFAIQAHNVSAVSSDLTIIPILSLGYSVSTTSPNPVSEVITDALPTFSLHTDFKISASGETLTLTDPEGNIIDQLETGNIAQDISRGRIPDGGEEWGFFDHPTPGSAVASQPMEIVDPPQFSKLGGLMDQGFSLELSSSENDPIRYTLDGSEPTSGSALYSEPISISETTIVRARAFRDDSTASKIATHSYFLSENSTFPIISLVIDPANLWDNQTGIYVVGTEGTHSDCGHEPANFFEDWEKPVHLSLFEPTGDAGFAMDAGIRIFGGCTRTRAQKSLAIIARSQYGKNSIDYQLFPDMNIDSFKSFILRISGNDWGSTLFRDAMMQSLVHGKTLLDTQAYRPSLVYLNGEFWGIYNIREKYNEHYIASHHGIAPENVITIKDYDLQLDSGYLELHNFVEGHDMTLEASYIEIRDLMDMDNYLDYMVSEIFFDNGDWPGINVRVWRPLDQSEPWKWQLFDTDQGFGYWGKSINAERPYENDTFAHATEKDGPGWPNPPWSTLLFRKLLENSTFQKSFLNRFAGHLNRLFSTDIVLDRIQSMKSVLEPEMPRHIERWGNANYSISSLSEWEEKLNVVIEFAQKRPQVVRDFLIDHFDTTGTYQITLNTSDNNHGKVKIDYHTIDTYPWTGLYFNDVPIQLTAIPELGYHFVRWEGASDETTDTITINSSQDVSVKAVFEVDENPKTVLISEIHFASEADFNPGDWIEFVNYGNSQVDLSNWIFLDSNDAHTFIFPEGTTIDAGEYLVLCRDAASFTNSYPGVQCAGEFNFGLSGNGEMVRLHSDAGQIVDSVDFEISSPWPVFEDGQNKTIALKDISSDNNAGENWITSQDHGTPGSNQE